VPLLLWIYQRLTPLVAGCVWVYVHHRLKKGKEDPDRLNERFGKASILRPKGSIVWFHGASVGEAVSLLPLLRHIRTQFPHITPLLTTGTVAAATVIAKVLPEGCLHQYSPLDVPAWIEQFLDHWQPKAAIFVESEFWPNLILTCHARKIPLYLVNAHLSEKSYHSWRRFPSVISHLLSCFEVCLAQSETIAQRLKDLGASPPKVRICGNLKFAANPLPFDAAEFTKIQSIIKNRLLWVAASTHSGEETLIGETHQLLKKDLPDALTIIIPRHIDRAEEIAKELTAKGLQVARRSCQEVIHRSTDVYLVDTMGELGLFYRLSDIAFIGGTFAPIGGHNPIEAALLDCALIWGPHIHNQTEICDILGAAASLVTTKEELAETVALLLVDERVRKEKVSITRRLLETQTHVLDYVIEALEEKLKEKDGGSDGTRTRDLRRDRPTL
jgi:3-deoxy-D-manno-octulosonic-acid transferase